MAEFSNIKESSNSLKNTLTSDWNSNSFGVSVDFTNSNDTFSTLVNSAEEAYNSVSTDVGNVWDYTKAAGIAASNIFEGDQYADVVDAAGSSAINYLNQKIERIKQAWTTTTTVSVSALMQEIAPYCLDWKTAIKLLGERIPSLISYLTGVQGETYADIGINLGKELSEYITTDPTVLDSVSNLQVIQATANALSAVSSIISTVETILGYLEPALPYLEIATNLALVLFSGGASAVEVGTKTPMTVQSEAQKLVSLLYEDARKALYNIKIKVPVALVGALDSISVRDYMMGYTSSEASSFIKWMKDAMGSDIYKRTINSLVFDDYIEKYFTKYIPGYGSGGNLTMNSFLNDLSNIIAGENGTNFYGDIMKGKFLSNLTTTFMTNAVDLARKKAYISDTNSIYYNTLNTNNIGDSNLNIEGIGSNFLDKDNSANKNSTDVLLGKNLGESPITDENSIRIISYNIYKGITGLN